MEALQAQIDVLSRERQELRAAKAGDGALERNRLKIIAAQWELSHALVRRHLPAL